MLNWVQPSGGAAVTRYEYEQNGSGTWTSTGGTATSYTVRNLTNGQSYSFRVRAVNSAGQSGASNSQSATPTATEPDAPRNLRSTPGNEQVTLRWTAPASDGGAPITRYEYEQNSSGTWTSTGGTTTSYTVRGLTNGQAYTFKVRAVNSIGESTATDPQSATPRAAPPPPDPEPEPDPDPTPTPTLPELAAWVLAMLFLGSGASLLRGRRPLPDRPGNTGGHGGRAEPG